MKKIIEYQCEICKSTYNTPEEAIRCESLGEYDGIEIPKGLIIQQDFYKDMTFAIGRFSKGYNKHYITPSFWAARDNNNGDNYGDTYCGGNDTWTKDKNLNNYYKVKDFNSPHFKRMVKYLIENNIDPYYWDGEKAVKFTGKI